MPSGYKSGGTDLDSLFKSATSYSGSISSEYKVSGSTSYTRYKARGSTTKRADVGYKISNSDISNTFMDISVICKTYNINYEEISQDVWEIDIDYTDCDGTPQSYYDYTLSNAPVSLTGVCMVQGSLIVNIGGAVTQTGDC